MKLPENRMRGVADLRAGELWLSQRPTPLRGSALQFRRRGRRNGRHGQVGAWAEDSFLVGGDLGTT